MGKSTLNKAKILFVVLLLAEEICCFPEVKDWGENREIQKIERILRSNSPRVNRIDVRGSADKHYYPWGGKRNGEYMRLLQETANANGGNAKYAVSAERLYAKPYGISQNMGAGTNGDQRISGFMERMYNVNPPKNNLLNKNVIGKILEFEKYPKYLELNQ